MSETWLTSDTHLGHDLVARLRGFEDSDSHDRAVASKWDKQVRAEDEVWVLGDVAMNGWLGRLSWFAQRPGTKHLVLGNHDRAHPAHSRGHAYIADYLTVFATVQTAARLRGGLLASHFPYAGEGQARPGKKDRSTQWRLRDEGAPLAHGHVHDAVRYRTSPAGTPMYHVGLDAWDLSPVTIHDLMKESQ